MERVAITEFGEDAVYTKEFKSPAQIEKLPKGKDFAKKYAILTPGPLKVARTSDKVEGVTPAGASAFAKVTNS